MSRQKRVGLNRLVAQYIYTEEPLDSVCTHETTILEQTHLLTSQGTLNMSRALGDLQYKNPINNLNISGGTKKAKRANASGSKIRGNILSNEAYVRTIKLDENSRYALLCCTDGVTDVTDEKQLMTEVVSDFVAGRRATDIARMVTTATGEQPHSDNCTCVIAFLDGVKALK